MKNKFKLSKLSRFLFIMTMILLSIAFVGCSDDGDNNDNNNNNNNNNGGDGNGDITAVALTLERDKASLLPSKDITVNITGGNGGYKATSSDENVAKAVIANDVITITAGNVADKANAVIVVVDKMFKRATISVDVANQFEMKLDQTDINLEVGIKGKDEATIHITAGNTGYTLTLLEDAAEYIEITDKTNLETAGKFSIKAKAEGVAKIEVKDALGKTATLTATGIPSTEKIEVDDPTAITLNAVQGSKVLNVVKGNGKYNVVFENPTIAGASVQGSKIIITGKRNGTTSFTVKDEIGVSSKPINITVAGNAYAMTLGAEYFCHTDFRAIAAVDKSIKECKQVTFEMVCKIDGYRGLQTFMGLEGNLILRGKNDDYKDTHPIEIAGLGDNIMALTTSNFKLNEWMHLALVVDCEKSTPAEKYKLYINGVQDVLNFTRTDKTHSSVDLTSSNDDSYFEIGCASKQDWRAMRGTVSEARVWRTARTKKQINDNICTFNESDASGLVSRWDFTAGTETDYIQDISGSYQINMIIAEIKGDFSFNATKMPASAFVVKGCPN